MAYSKKDQAMAMAGMFQAASLVQQIANTGSANSALVDTCIETLFRFDASSVEDVYGSVANIRHGLELFNEALGKREARDLDITGYILAMITLERKLSARPKMLDKIESRLRDIESQFEFFAINHENTYAKLGELYKDTISKMGPKIIVKGERPHLANENNASKVRALLLAGIRSAVLWRQVGGTRLKLLFTRDAYQRACEELLR
jgi:high frequency lysogenization protein